MNRRLIGALLVPLVLIGGGLSSPALARKAKATIEGMSHTHPEGLDYSYVCAKIKGKAGRRLTVTATGPAVSDDPITFKARRGVRTVSFEIEAAGPYTITVTNPSGKVLDSETYTVPPPPPGGPAQGPFPCPA